MSFLQDLRTRKNLLKHGDTLVTRPDGTRYIERHSSSSNSDIIPQQSALGFVVDTAPDDVPAFVVPHLFMGSQDCCMPHTLRQHDIACVLSVGVQPFCTDGQISYSYVPCLDLPDTDMAHIFVQCNNIIRRARNRRANILVHCNAGISRSAAVVLAYLILEMHMTYAEAYQLLKAARPCIQPNVGFVTQLKKL